MCAAALTDRCKLLRNKCRNWSKRTESVCRSGNHASSTIDGYTSMAPENSSDNEQELQAVG
eukprot:m.2281 g.2281  ORF g.2281 m.2281 type:complete len:61 (-) comp1128_c0_seq3:664-846(-)